MLQAGPEHAKFWLAGVVVAFVLAVYTALACTYVRDYRRRPVVAREAVVPGDDMSPGGESAASKIPMTDQTASASLSESSLVVALTGTVHETDQLHARQAAFVVRIPLANAIQGSPDNPQVFGPASDSAAFATDLLRMAFADSSEMKRVDYLSAQMET